MTARSRIVPLVVASPMFLQNIDSSAMATALPTMARALGVPALQLNLVISAYLLSLAVFLPMSAWLADRFGAKRMFCVAIVLFSVASGLCGMATAVSALVLCRVLQGMGAAMMVPVSRLLLLRSVEPAEMVTAMIWYTVPPVIGRLAGPLIGGAIVSVASWHWIFYVNIPFGIVSVLLAWRFVDDAQTGEATPPFDLPGFALLALGLAALLGGLEAASKGMTSGWVSGLAMCGGLATLGLYARASRRQADPVIDLRILRFKTFRTNVLGAAPLRLSVMAVPFLLPLLLQLGFGLSPLESGLLSAASALGALCTRGVMRGALGRYGFRRVLLGGTVLTSLLYISYALFRPGTSHALMFCVLFASGLLGAICMVSLNTIGFVEIPKERMSHATALASMAQQMTAGVAVIWAGSLLTFFSWWAHGNGQAAVWQDFGATFAAIGLTALLSLFSFARLHAKETHGLS